MFKSIAVAVACAMCMALGPAVLFVGTFPIFLPAVSDEFGWGAGIFPQGLLLMGAANALAALIGGRLVDRFSVRWLVLAGLVCWAGTLFALSVMNGSEAQLLVVTAVMGAAGCFCGTVALAKVIASWFDRHRGLAMAVTLGASPAVGTSVMVVVANYLVAPLGWRLTYQLFATMVVLVCVPLTLLFMREPSHGAAHVSAESRVDATDGSVRQALFSVAFWKVVIATMLVGSVVSALNSHLVAWSAERGITQTAAAFALSAFYLANPVGAIVSGAVADRVSGPRPLALFYGLPLLGFALLLAFGAPALLLAMVLMGAGFGAASTLMLFLVTRYFGIQNAAQLMGIGVGVCMLMLGVGPVVLGYAHDHFHSFAPATPVLSALLAVSIAVYLTLKPYRVAPQAELVIQQPVDAIR